MMEHVLDKDTRAVLAQGTVFLASRSPRRKDILVTQLGLDVEVFPSGFPENFDKLKSTPVEVCKKYDVFVFVVGWN